MKTQAKVALGIVVLLIAGLLGYFLSVKGDDEATKKAIDATGAPVAVSAADQKAAKDAGIDGVVLSWAGTDVVVEEFMDFECPACKAQTVLMDDLLKKYAGKVTVVARPLPLTQIHHNATQAWLAALAANEQGKFGEMYKQLFATQEQWTGEKDQSALFRQYADKLGLDLTKYDAAVASPANKQVLDDSVAAATKLGAQGTPTWILNGQLLPLESDTTLTDAVAEELGLASSGGPSAGV